MNESILTIREENISSYVMYTLANNCMPTLLKSKASSLINFQKKYISNVIELYDVLEKEIAYFGCDYEVLYESDKAYFVLIYNISLLEEILSNSRSSSILTFYGYEYKEDNVKNTVKHFKKRFSEYNKEKMDFPHEIGVLLGYPIEDVEGYIKNKGENYKICGLWKVYTDVEKAEKTFEFFKRIRREALMLILSGKGLWEMNGCHLGKTKLA